MIVGEKWLVPDFNSRGFDTLKSNIDVKSERIKGKVRS